MTDNSVKNEDAPQLHKIMGEKLLKQQHVDCIFAFVDEKGGQKEPETFGTHACILANGSDVFEAMLFGELKEKSPILIKDIGLQIFKKLVG